MQLVQLEGKKTQQIDVEAEMGTAPIHESQIPGGAPWISLHLLESGNILPVTERSEFTLGRVSENQPIMPDIDLSPYKAYDNGVSRLHAVVRQQDNRVVIMDLGSSNGTYINGVRLAPNVENMLKHSDVISLGKLKIQVVLS
jgi:predicted component of type VI protein secretion system